MLQKNAAITIATMSYSSSYDGLLWGYLVISYANVVDLRAGKPKVFRGHENNPKAVFA